MLRNVGQILSQDAGVIPAGRRPALREDQSIGVSSGSISSRLEAHDLVCGATPESWKRIGIVTLPPGGIMPGWRAL